MSKLPLKVDDERWQEAQEWELAVWQRQARHFRSARSRVSRFVRRLLGASAMAEMDDWNYWWAERFEGYRFLPQEIENAVELGCGPHTNMRLILRDRRIKHVFCSDPLARQYINLKGTWLSRAWRRGETLVDDHPIERCPFASDYFGLVVLINVLDHVQDAVDCIRQAARITAPGGCLLVGQDLSTEQDVQRTAGDIGHPVRISQEVIEAELDPCFEPLLRKILPRDRGRNPDAHCATYIFAGRKRPTSCALNAGITSTSNS
jgi:SAM-dependent methyltransferase